MIDLFAKDRFQRLPSAVIFDTDNTLYEYEPAHRAATAAAVEKAVKLLNVRPDNFETAFDAARREVKDLLGATASSHSRLLYFQRTVENLGFKTQILATLDLEQTYWRTFLANAVLFEDAADFIQDLRSYRIPLGVVTDLTAQIQFRKLVYFGLDDVFDYIVTSEEAGHDKPHLAPFQQIDKKLGSHGAETWIIGDSLEKDIVGGKQALNATTLQKRHQGIDIGNGTGGADLVFDTFSELRAFTQKLFQNRSTV